MERRGSRVGRDVGWGRRRGETIGKRNRQRKESENGTKR